MTLKTENLAIVLTDIAGYTERTSHQSRRENERLLEQHNDILYPLIKKYKGRLIKTIGDALLMVFRSPTDAMLCAMAMQDALYEFNRKLPEEKQIHIRIAASLGEVRVTRNDIFGEPVNMTSRIEGITPKDEIYLSEAIYMAMNKAEVPCQEVGWRELKGISEPIRIFNIPRFSTPRLVPEDVMGSEDIGDLVYPFGGAHRVAAKPSEGQFDIGELLHDKPLMHKLEGAIAAAVVIVLAMIFYPTLQSRLVGSGEPVTTSAPPAPAAESTPGQGAAEVKEAPATAPQAAKEEVKPEATVATPAAPKTEPAPVAPGEPATSKTAPAIATKPVAKPAAIAPAKPTVTKVAPAPVAKPAPAPKPAPVVVPKPVAKTPPPAPKEPIDRYPTFSSAKAAYNANRLDKTEYRELVREIKSRRKEELDALEREYDAKIAELKQQYRSGAISKAEYNTRVGAEKARYKAAVRVVDQRYD